MKKPAPKSFRSQIHVILCLLGILPYLLVIYIFIHKDMNFTEIILFFGAMVLVFHLSGFYILRTFSDRLTRLVSDISTSTRPQKNSSVPFNDNSVIEIRDISHRFNHLVDELNESKKNFSDVTIALMKQAKEASSNHQDKIFESEERENILKPYIGANIFEQLIHSNNLENSQINSRREVSILFADIRAFTAISETSEPEDVVSMLNEYFELMVEIIHSHNGVLDKFIGDELMAVFGLISSPNETAVGAVNAAIEMQAASKQLMIKRAQRKLPTFSVGIGINSGQVIAGDIGSRDRRDYTVIGDSVNVASRLVQIADGDEILISRQTHDNCHNSCVTEKKGAVQVKNRLEEVEFFKVISKKMSAEK